jgi:hypothetical protein
VHRQRTRRQPARRRTIAIRQKQSRIRPVRCRIALPESDTWGHECSERGAEVVIHVDARSTPRPPRAPPNRNARIATEGGRTSLKFLPKHFDTCPIGTPSRSLQLGAPTGVRREG